MEIRDNLKEPKLLRIYYKLSASKSLVKIDSGVSDCSEQTNNQNFKNYVCDVSFVLSYAFSGKILIGNYGHYLYRCIDYQSRVQYYVHIYDGIHMGLCVIDEPTAM